MHFQVWFPGKTNNGAQLLRDVGLADFVEGHRECMTTQRLPDGVVKDGLQVSWGGGDAGYFPDRQSWVPLRSLDFGEIGPQLGYWLDSPCTPDDLRRGSLFNGYKVKLADGNEWQVPLAVELPATLRLVERAWTKVRKPQFDDFWAQSEVWYRRFMLFDLNPDTMASQEGIDAAAMQTAWAEFCVFSLRQNYRVTAEIASELGILDTDSLLRITWSVIDGMAIKEVLNEMQGIADRDSAFEKKAAAV